MCLMSIAREKKRKRRLSIAIVLVIVSVCLYGKAVYESFHQCGVDPSPMVFVFNNDDVVNKATLQNQCRLERDLFVLAGMGVFLLAVFVGRRDIPLLFRRMSKDKNSS